MKKRRLCLLLAAYLASPAVVQCSRAVIVLREFLIGIIICVRNLKPQAILYFLPIHSSSIPKAPFLRECMNSMTIISFKK
jgi:hypothetical protein